PIKHDVFVEVVLQRRLAAELSVSQWFAICDVIGAIALEWWREPVREQARSLHRVRKDERAVVVRCRIDACLVEGTCKEVGIDLVVIRVAQANRRAELLSELEIRLSISGQASVAQAGYAEGRRIGIRIRDVVPVVPGGRPRRRQNSGG